MNVWNFSHTCVQKVRICHIAQRTIVTMVTNYMTKKKVMPVTESYINGEGRGI